MHRIKGIIVGLMAIGACSVLQAQGVLRSGFGARDAGSAGAFGGTSEDALPALQTNPASLAWIPENQWELSLRGGWGRGVYGKGGTRSTMEVIGGFPEWAVAWKPQQGPLTLGLSAAPLAIGVMDWDYPDAAGGIGGISYGSSMAHDSGFSSWRVNAGLAWQPIENFSIGASLGAVYSRVDFDAPFIFQSNPALAGAKVDLDFDTEGWEAMTELGVSWKPVDDLTLGIRYRPQMNLNLSGRGEVDFSAQLPPLGLGGAPSYATYDVRTSHALPQVAGGGFSWEIGDRWKVGAWADWMGWKRAFDDLEVTLANGSNAVVNGAIGATVRDRVPIRWKNAWVVAVGTEWKLQENLSLRAGWRYGEPVVEDAWATPLNASLQEHALALGLGWKKGEWNWDVSYEYQFGDASKVGKSRYRAGEYDFSKIDISAHLVGVGVRRGF